MFALSWFYKEKKWQKMKAVVDCELKQYIITGKQKGEKLVLG